MADSETIDLLLGALALKERPRRGWYRAGLARPESVADHSWGVALLAVALCPPTLDRARVLELAVLHDVCEAAVGDLVPGEYESRDAKIALERAGLVDLLGGAPAPLRERLLGAFDEMAQDRTAEARFVHELDKLEMALQAKRYQDAGVPRNMLASYRASARKGAPSFAAALGELERPRQK